ncbi:hypothetical protein ACFOZ0_32045 [Streptomyces yaanensis]|uniref:Integral membrane protein n=1 Tax=Streptomyces yaanensis TaxID=1142239 RepID=A0ABV7SQ12_9ACTN|nr:hypothetical protein [Streptomyces sp. CGMCC 4.7035]WNC02091.1 hypothetical protein Q2K21_30760 [Streptomyces sp. CGMCC 4.7035]
MSVGLPVGFFFGALVLAESGSWVGAAVVAFVLSLFYGIRVARRMSRAWPEAKQLDPVDRAVVVRATRRGEGVPEARLAPAVIEYGDGLRRAREYDRLFLWIVVLVAVLAVALAVYDTFTGSTREMAVSWLLVALLLVELTWGPRKQARVLSNAERAEGLARRALRQMSLGD